MEPAELRKLAASAVEKHADNATAAKLVFKAGDTAALALIGATRLVEIARCEANERIKYPSAKLVQGEPLKPDLAGRTAIMVGSILDWVIDGRKLAEMTCGELAKLAETHAEIARGHAANSRFFAALAAMGDEDAEVGKILTPVKADRLWKKCQQETSGPREDATQKRLVARVPAVAYAYAQ